MEYGDYQNPILITDTKKSRSEQRLIDFCNRLKDIAYKEKAVFEYQWLETIAMFLGYDSNVKRGSLLSGFISWLSDPKQQAVKRNHVVANRMFSFYKRALARLTSGRPFFEIVPASDDPEDKRRAELQKAILDYTWQKSVLDMESKRRELAFWALMTGTGIAKIEWNPSNGIMVDYKAIAKLDKEQAKVNLETSGIDILEDNLRAKEILEQDENADIAIGDVDVRIISPFDIYVPLQYYDIQKAPYVIHYYTSRIEDLIEIYPKAKQLRGRSKIDPIKKASEIVKHLAISSGFSVATSYQMPLDAAMDPKDEGIVVVYEIWQRRSKKHPFGRVSVVSEDVLLHDGPNPYQHGKYPFVVYREVDVPFRFWGASSLQQCIDLQKSYTKTRNEEISAVEYTAQPIMITYTGSKINKRKIIPKPGSVIEAIAKGYEPHYLEKGRTEIAAFKNLEASTIDDMQDIMSQHEISRGVSPSNVESGLALSYLAQRDELAMTTSLDAMVDTLEKIARMILQVYAQFADEPRLVKITGDAKQVQVREFIGEDLVGTDPRKDYFDIRVKRSSITPVNKAAQKSEIFAMLQSGLIDPRNASQMRYVRFLWDNVADFEDINLEDRLDEARANEEIYMILNGEEVTVMPYENHEIHIDVFTRYMKTKEFYNLDADTQNRFLAHLQIHKDYIMQAYQAMVGPQEIAGEQNQQTSNVQFTDQGTRQAGQQRKNVVPPYGMSNG